MTSSNHILRVCLSFRRFGMLKNKNHRDSMLCRCAVRYRNEIGLPLAGAKTSEMIAKHVHMRKFVLLYMCYVIRQVSEKLGLQSVKATFSPQSAFYA